MMDEFVGKVEVRCPTCGQTSSITIRWPIAEAICSQCQQRFEPDEVLIKGYYNCDDQALWHLELLYRGSLVKYFLDHNVGQTDAEELQINLFGEVQRSKGQETGRYDSDAARSFKTWVTVKAKYRLIDHTRSGARFSTVCAECSATVPYLASESDRLNRADGSEPSKPCPQCGATVHLPRASTRKSVPLSAVSQDGDGRDFDAADNDRLFGAYEQAFSDPFEAAVVHEFVDAIEECKAALDEREQLALQVWLEHSGARGTGNELVNRLKIAFPDEACSPATASRLTQRALEKIGACLKAKGIELDTLKQFGEARS
jgi:DNA-directed RNA polymerase specialized sigma24 family protein